MGNRSVRAATSSAPGIELAVDGAEPSGYGLGKAGWVSLQTKTVTAALLADCLDQDLQLLADQALAAGSQQPLGRAVDQPHDMILVDRNDAGGHARRGQDVRGPDGAGTPRVIGPRPISEGISIIAPNRAARWSTTRTSFRSPCHGGRAAAPSCSADR